MIQETHGFLNLHREPGFLGCMISEMAVLLGSRILRESEYWGSMMTGYLVLLDFMCSARELGFKMAGILGSTYLFNVLRIWNFFA